MKTVDKRVKWILYLSIIAIILSAYLTYVHYSADNLGICTLEGSKFDCEKLSKTKYAYFFGVDWLLNSNLGILGYSALSLLAFLMLKTKARKFKEKYASLILAGASLAFFYAIYLTIVEFAIQIFCPFCLISQFVILIITILALLNYLELKGIQIVME